MSARITTAVLLAVAVIGCQDAPPQGSRGSADSSADGNQGASPFLVGALPETNVDRPERSPHGGADDTAGTSVSDSEICVVTPAVGETTPVEVVNDDGASGEEIVMVAAGSSDTTAPIKPVFATESARSPSFPDAYSETPAWVKEGPEGAVRVSFDDLDLLKIMGLDPVTMSSLEAMPERITVLDGKRIRLRGFMYPPFAPDGLTGFVLARDNEICCFGRSPKIYDLVPVELRSGETTRYIEGRPFDVVGVMHIEADADADDLFQLFYMDDALVIE